MQTIKTIKSEDGYNGKNKLNLYFILKITLNFFFNIMLNYIQLF